MNTRLCAINALQHILNNPDIANDAEFRRQIGDILSLDYFYSDELGIRVGRAMGDGVDASTGDQDGIVRACIRRVSNEHWD